MLAGGKSHAEIARSVGRTANSIRSLCSLRGWVCRDTYWSDEDVARLVAWYGRDGLDGRDQLNLEELASSLGRDKHNVCRKARSLGLTKKERAFKGHETRKSISDKAKKRIAEKGHPRGALGIRHSDETKAVISRKSKECWVDRKNMPLFLDACQRAILKTKIERYGTGSPATKSENAYSRCVRGRREDLGNKFFRSRWEANYARYLRWLESIGQIKEWQHEPRTFRFDGVSRGPYTYLPDFRVVNLDGTVEWHEVKGWMDAASRGRLKRFAKFYPQEKLVLVEEKMYRQIESKLSLVIPNWERSK